MEHRINDFTKYRLDREIITMAFYHGDNQHNKWFTDSFTAYLNPEPPRSVNPIRKDISKHFELEIAGSVATI